MKNRSATGIAVITVMILVICALLPVIVLKTGDIAANKRVHTVEMKTIQFARELTDADRLYLLGNGMRVTTSEEKTNLRTEDLIETIRPGLTAYLEAGLIQGNVEDYAITEALPYRMYSNVDSNISCAFWYIDLETPDQPGRYVTISLDDQTGRIMQISYTNVDTICSADSLRLLLDVFITVYAAPIELDFMIDACAYVYEDTDMSASARLYCEDTAYGELGIKLNLIPYGFFASLES